MNRTTRPALFIATLALVVAGCGGGGVGTSTRSTPVVPIAGPTTNIGLPNVTPVPGPSVTPFSTPTPIAIVTPVATPTPTPVPGVISTPAPIATPTP